MTVNVFLKQLDVRLGTLHTRTPVSCMRHHGCKCGVPEYRLSHSSWRHKGLWCWDWQDVQCSSCTRLCILPSSLTNMVVHHYRWWRVMNTQINMAVEIPLLNHRQLWPTVAHTNQSRLRLAPLGRDYHRTAQYRWRNCSPSHLYQEGRTLTGSEGSCIPRCWLQAGETFSYHPGCKGSVTQVSVVQLVQPWLYGNHWPSCQGPSERSMAFLERGTTCSDSHTAVVSISMSCVPSTCARPPWR